MTRDLTWDAIATACERMKDRADQEDLTVRPSTHRSWLRWEAVEGFEVINNWTEVFEPVRKRRLFAAGWTEIQPVQDAAANVARFLSERPDLQ